ncbi:response regulator [Bythopirellula polymerisocia]|nr:response regulator [Bythopirellula polymerisocia]
MIAVIDDNESWIEAVKDVLANEGFEVCSATNEDQAIEILDTVRPQLIILDVHIPGARGLRLISDFRGRDRTTPILVVSSDDRSLVRNQAMSNGASGFLQKPIPSQILLRAVRRYVQPGSGEQGDSLSPCSRLNPSVN